MYKKGFLLVLLAGVFFLSGCANFSIGKGGGRFTVPFDFPQKNSDENK